MKAQEGNAGIGVCGVLGVVFVVLKLIGTLDWSWWIVLLPFYGGFALVLVIMLFCVIMAGLTGQLSKKR